MKIKQIALASLAVGTLLVSLGLPVSQVAQANSVQNSYQLNKPGPAKLTYEEVLASEVDLKDIYLINGIAFDKNGNAVVEHYGESQNRGKYSWLVKAIRNIYHRLPGFVKSTIKKYVGLEGFLNLIDKATGSVEDAIFWACKQVGMPDWLAWTVTKAITLLVL
ncbi:hypothetical protein [Lactococcus termiticola]|uniref:Uncharacterized protein n=1 Tax=Lactococcus termiticola TaxID=2169526 RepID=A0A2R5HDJ7_9LACT|nr:hypothetical protein [Lactococcus termiticola]GBG96139.1 hypothetical protein NtB2_00244 [Lactococcus termiticola]